jgi:hypothetical protein
MTTKQNMLERHSKYYFQHTKKSIAQTKDHQEQH